MLVCWLITEFSFQMDVELMVVVDVDGWWLISEFSEAISCDAEVSDIYVKVPTKT